MRTHMTLQLLPPPPPWQSDNWDFGSCRPTTACSPAPLAQLELVTILCVPITGTSSRTHHYYCLWGQQLVMEHLLCFGHHVRRSTGIMSSDIYHIWCWYYLSAIIGAIATVSSLYKHRHWGRMSEWELAEHREDGEEGPPTRLTMPTIPWLGPRLALLLVTHGAARVIWFFQQMWHLSGQVFYYTAVVTGNATLHTPTHIIQQSEQIKKCLGSEKYHYIKN